MSVCVCVCVCEGKSVSELVKEKNIPSELAKINNLLPKLWVRIAWLLINVDISKEFD